MSRVLICACAKAQAQNLVGRKLFDMLPTSAVVSSSEGNRQLEETPLLLSAAESEGRFQYEQPERQAEPEPRRQQRTADILQAKDFKRCFTPSCYSLAMDI